VKVKKEVWMKQLCERKNNLLHAIKHVSDVRLINDCRFERAFDEGILRGCLF
jgi:hypothetical protein